MTDKPTHPGIILLEEFLKPQSMTQIQLSKLTGMSVQRINKLIKGKSGITPKTAILLSRTLKTTSGEYWMELQNKLNLWNAQEKLARR